MQAFEGSMVWNVGNADNRFERRRMDEENKKLQAKERRLFSEQVRCRVWFMAWGTWLKI